MEKQHSWKRRFVGYVEARGDTETGKHLYLSVKIPRPMADSIARDCADRGIHAMVYYCDAFAEGLAAALTKTEVKTIS
jgi:hypothetical protein